MEPIIFDSSDRWRKKVENHILMSYFTKQAGHFFGSSDFIPGSGDIPDLCVEVELFPIILQLSGGFRKS